MSASKRWSDRYPTRNNFGVYYEGHHSGWRQRDPTLSSYICDLETIAARLRQTDDLLPFVDPHVGGNQGHLDYHDSA